MLCIHIRSCSNSTDQLALNLLIGAYTGIDGIGASVGSASATFGATIKPMRLLKNDLRLFMEDGAGGQIRTDGGIAPASLQN